jgi:AraC-like DNA-binding protein
MDDFPQPLSLMSAPFGHRKQRINSTRYYWDNSARHGDYVILQRTISGYGGFRLDGREYEVPAGHAFIAIAPEPSAYYYPPGAGQPWELTWLNFYGRLSVELCADIRRRFGPVLPLDEHSAAGIAFEALVTQREQRVAQDPLDASLAIYRFLLEWTRELTAPSREALDPVEIVAHICQARFREPIGTKELAAEAGLSREHLSRLFTERKGLSPGRYLRGLRVRAAQEMLANGRTPLQEVALRCGFPSIRSLNRALEGVDY